MAKLSKTVLLWRLLLVPLAAAYPQLQAELRHRTIKPEDTKGAYDYIIVGGGQSGLVVANRLSEDPKVSVLVVEYGYFDNSYDVLDHNNIFRDTTAWEYNITSVAQTGLGEANRFQKIRSAAVVGGGSAINGMFFNRGSAEDYDDWEKLGNPGWGFNGLLPYFRKSQTLQTPNPNLARDFNVTWDSTAFGNGPIQASIYPVQYPEVGKWYQGFVEAGLEPQQSGDNGHAHGLFWSTRAVDDRTRTRSYARNQYYDPIKDRKNLDLLTGWRVNTVKFDKNKQVTGIVMQPRDSINDPKAKTTTIKAKKEVVLSSGAYHTPQILQRSGIGPASHLKKANIPVLVDLPGVGSNLQDHAVVSMYYQYTNAKPLPPPPAEGPYPVMANSVALLPVKDMAPSSYLSIARDYLAQQIEKVLPESYTKEQKAGYLKQRELLAADMKKKTAAFVEIPFTGNDPLYIMVQMKPVSRGTVMLNTTDIYAEPVVDFRTFFNPVDVAIARESLKFVRDILHKTPSFQSLGPLELDPGLGVAGDEALDNRVRSNAGSTTAHQSGTAAMMPRELGGVVDSQLRVYGVRGLRVVDTSIMPLVPAAHTCSSTYAVAEKGADLIKGRKM
ncbi:hypothetical protein B0T09DRAFT_101695 [Sordaria sp. MPI-SDFR-AT-0083]|nr:hypothetical protein B0T09DRAFT_101695 [Sordaria sp. MPI-SDFR-AT-0083]